VFEQTFKNIDDVLWKEAGCTTELDYVEQTSWLLFLKYLDDLEKERAIQAELASRAYGTGSDRRSPIFIPVYATPFSTCASHS
jgi:hypothetical protein